MTDEPFTNPELPSESAMLGCLLVAVGNICLFLVVGYILWELLF